MYFLLFLFKMGIFNCYVCLPEGRNLFIPNWYFNSKQTLLVVPVHLPIPGQLDLTETLERHCHLKVEWFTTTIYVLYACIDLYKHNTYISIYIYTSYDYMHNFTFLFLQVALVFLWKGLATPTKKNGKTLATSLTCRGICQSQPQRSRSDGPTIL